VRDVRLIDDEEYDSHEEWQQQDTTTQQTSIPEQYVVELRQTNSDQLDDVIQSTVNISTTTSIYDFQGKYKRRVKIGNAIEAFLVLCN